MKNYLLLLFAFCISFAQAQTVLYDFETPETSTSFQIFGGNLEGALVGAIANPDPSGINTSSMVLEAKKASDAPEWGGMFSNPGPATIPTPAGGQVCMDIWMPRTGNINLKLENGVSDAPENYRQERLVTTANTWETLCFDLDQNSLEGDMTPATGKPYNNIVIFPDFGVPGDGTELVVYIDNVTVPEGGDVSDMECINLYDFEAPETSVNAFYFGSNQEGDSTGIVTNPNPTAPNESGTVMEYVRGGDAMTWAGAAINLASPLETSNVTEICLKVHAPTAGNMTIKLEKEAFDDPTNWISTLENNNPGAWQELCFDLREPSFEGDMTPGVGKTFVKMILFPDFGKPGTGAEEFYYLDDFVIKTDNTEQSYDVTFNVDMSGYTEAFTSVNVSGTFNSWSGDSNPMTDDDGDGIYSATVTVDQGTIEWKYTIDNWTVQENFDGTETCTTPVSAEFRNRVLTVIQEEDLAPVCWESCYACGESVKITWNLNMNEETVSDDGVYLAGGADFGHGDFPMTDPDGDGVYSITIERENGYSGNYTFINGICLPDWSCKENIAGQDCADPDNFNDRILDPVTADTEFNTCFGQCTTDGTCEGSSLYTVTFRVDMNNETVDGDVFIAGATINNWDPTATMMSNEGFGIYSYTLEMAPGAHEYKFINGSAWEELTQGDDCTITDVSGSFTNRLLLLGEMDTVVDTYVFGTCSISTDTDDLAWDADLARIMPTVFATRFNIEFNESANDLKEVTILDINGKVMNQTSSTGANVAIDGADWASGIYMVRIVHDGQFVTQRIVKQ